MIVLKKPIITEKTLREYKENSVVTFSVNLDANKFSIKNAIEQVYEVKVSDIRVVNRLGKEKFSRFSKKRGKLHDNRIAYIKLAKDNKIDIFEQ